MPEELVEEIDNEKEIEKEIEEFDKTTFQVMTITGEVFNLPRVGWVAEMKILKALGDLLKKLPQDFIMGIGPSGLPLDFRNLSSDELLRILNFICEEAPDQITMVVSEILKKDSDWVKENLDLNEIVKVLIPFFYGRRLKLSHSFLNWKEKALPNRSKV